MGSQESKGPTPEQQRQMKAKREQEDRVNKQVQAEKVTNNLDINIKEYDNKVRKYEAKIDVMKEKAKQYIAEGKQKEAKKILQEATRLKKQLESIEVRKKVIEQKKFDVQVHQMNKETIDAMAEANQLTKEDYTEKMQQHIIDAREQKMISKEIDDKMKDLVDDDDELEQADDLMKELQAEVSKEKKKNIAQKNVGVNLNTNVQTQKQKAKESDDIDKMLNEL